MSKVFASISMSLDGFIAGPKPSLKDPLGLGGMRLHEWVIKLRSWREPHGRKGGQGGRESDEFAKTITRTGAVIMGRKMFSNGTGPWEKDKNADGWWGDNPPFHVPVFILTSHPRKAIVKEGGTTFTFVTEGPEQALALAKKAAGSKDISVAGGAMVIQEYIKLGELDELEIHIAPILLGGGTKLLDKLDPQTVKKISVNDSKEVTHLKYSFKKYARL